jgi:hypothetical protein
MAAIGVEAEGDDAPAPADTGATPAGGDGAATPAESKPTRGKGKARAGKTATVTGKPEADAQQTGKPTPRAGTKQAQMIELLKRPEGATVEQIAEATGWQHHTIRGAISGALKKKLGLTVEAIQKRYAVPLRRRGLTPGGDLLFRGGVTPSRIALPGPS